MTSVSKNSYISCVFNSVLEHSFVRCYNRGITIAPSELKTIFFAKYFVLKLQKHEQYYIFLRFFRIREKIEKVLTFLHFVALRVWVVKFDIVHVKLIESKNRE